MASASVPEFYDYTTIQVLKTNDMLENINNDGNSARYEKKEDIKFIFGKWQQY